MPIIAHTTCFELKWTSFQKNRKLRHLFTMVTIFPQRSWKTMYDGSSSSEKYLKNMASYYDWAFRWLQSLLALQICSVSQKIHKNCEKKRKLSFKKAKYDFLMRQEKMTRAVDGKQLFSFRWPYHCLTMALSWWEN